MPATVAIPPAVFVLAMNAEIEFPGWTVPELQIKFFLGATQDNSRNLLAPGSPGCYVHRKRAPADDRALPGTVFLFQADASIIASAVLVRIERFTDVPETADNHGAFWFLPESVRVFRPVSADEMKIVWPDDFKGFSRSQYLSPPANYLHLHSRLRGVAAPVPTFPVNEN